MLQWRHEKISGAPEVEAGTRCNHEGTTGMKKLLLGATALTLCAGFSTAAHAEFTLNILHINDFHSRFDPITGSDSNCDAETDAKGECFGGIARLKTIIDDTRAK